MWKFISFIEFVIIIATYAVIGAYYYRGKLEAKAQRHGKKKKKS